ncbi:MAG TPA: hypothetical protein VHG89_04835 [Verrucomicrobiae bacterium]|nr:hypothetical protein [Verrucomicrobiae bacterium]
MPPNISLDEIDDDAGETAAPEPAASQREADSEIPPEKTEVPSGHITITPPDKTTAQVLPAATDKDGTLPSDLKSAINALKKAEALPYATKAQKTERDAQLARLRPHVARLQEGVPTPVLTAKDLGNYHHQLVTSAKRERLELLARSSPEIAELLKERDALAAEIDKLKTLLTPSS